MTSFSAQSGLRLPRAFRACAVVVFGCIALAAPGAAAEAVLGVEIVPYSKKVNEHRFESPRDYDGTLKFFRDQFKGWKQVKWTREVSLPAVKYIHIDNLNEKSNWEGINIYELPNGRVRYTLLKRLPKAAPPPSSSNAPTAPPATPR
jgi:hypothetical protein